MSVSGTRFPINSDRIRPDLMKSNRGRSDLSMGLMDLGNEYLFNIKASSSLVIILFISNLEIVQLRFFYHVILFT